MTIDVEQIKAQAFELNKEVRFADGLDKAIIGIVVNNENQSVIAYSIPKIIEILMGDNELPEEEAYEWFDFNIAGAYVGKGTPVYLDILEIIQTGEPVKYREGPWTR